VVPDLAVPVTLNNWWGFGEVRDIQLIPFECIVGPGGACLGLPNRVPEQSLPTPPEWLTSAVTGACVLDLATLGAPSYVKGLHRVWITGLGGAIRVQNASDPFDKAWIIITTVMPFGSCLEWAAVFGVPLATAGQEEVQQALQYPRLVESI
jgi:hypothetical protein